MPATVSAWIALAPETLRERKIRSGTSGFATVASRTMKAASNTSEPAANASVWVAPHPSVAAGSTIV